MQRELHDRRLGANRGPSAHAYAEPSQDPRNVGAMHFRRWPESPSRQLAPAPPQPPGAAAPSSRQDPGRESPPSRPAEARARGPSRARAADVAPYVARCAPPPACLGPRPLRAASARPGGDVALVSGEVAVLGAVTPVQPTPLYARSCCSAVSPTSWRQDGPRGRIATSRADRLPQGQADVMRISRTSISPQHGAP